MGVFANLIFEIACSEKYMISHQNRVSRSDLERRPVSVHQHRVAPIGLAMVFGATLLDFCVHSVKQVITCENPMQHGSSSGTN